MLIKALLSSKISIIFVFRLFDAGRRRNSQIWPAALANSPYARR